MKKDGLGGVYLKKNKHRLYCGGTHTGSGGRWGVGGSADSGRQIQDFEGQVRSPPELILGKGDWLLKRDT